MACRRQAKIGRKQGEQEERRKLSDSWNILPLARIDINDR